MQFESERTNEASLRERPSSGLSGGHFQAATNTIMLAHYFDTNSAPQPQPLALHHFLVITEAAAVSPRSVRIRISLSVWSACCRVITFVRFQFASSVLFCINK